MGSIAGKKPENIDQEECQVLQKLKTGKHSKKKQFQQSSSVEMAWGELFGGCGVVLLVCCGDGLVLFVVWTRTLSDASSYLLLPPSVSLLTSLSSSSFSSSLFLSSSSSSNTLSWTD